MKQCCLLLLVLLPAFIKGQTQVIDSALIHLEIPFGVYKTDNRDMGPNEVLGQNFVSRNQAGTAQPETWYWIRYDLSEHLQALSQAGRWQLEVTPVDYASLFFRKNGSWEERKFGFLEKVEADRPGIHSFSVSFSADELIEGKYLLIRIRKVAYFMNMASFRSRITPSDTYWLEATRYTWKDITGALPNFLFIGAASVLMLFAMVFFFMRRRLEFLYYGLYLGMLIIYLGRRSLHLHDELFSQVPVADWIIHMQSQIAINLFYVLFVRHFLNTRRNYPLLEQVIRWIILFLLLTMTADLILILAEQFRWHIHIMNLHRGVMSLFAVAGSVWLLVNARDRLVYFVVIGSLFFTAGALGMLFLNLSLYMIAGALVETITFGAGLAYKQEQINREKQALELAAARTELSALKAQMNPHFIFNSLSSIQNLIISGERKASLTYLSRFSKLLRKTLDSSVDASHTLSAEVEMLRTYLELESLRFNNDFKYTLEVASELEEVPVEVPVFIIQPFVENAIIHGLKPSEKEEKFLRIILSDAGDHVVCVVEDNGIGREEASRHHQKPKGYRSHGMSVTMKRLHMEGSTPLSGEVVHIEDLSENGKALGTRVTIRIPKLL